MSKKKGIFSKICGLFKPEKSRDVEIKTDTDIDVRKDVDIENLNIYITPDAADRYTKRSKVK